MQRADDSQACIRSALRRRRRTLGLTQEHAASLLGMSRISYHRIETGARRIRFSELAAICAAFNCHIGELVQDGAAGERLHPCRQGHTRGGVAVTQVAQISNIGNPRAGDPAHHAVAVTPSNTDDLPPHRLPFSSAEPAI